MPGILHHVVVPCPRNPSTKPGSFRPTEMVRDMRGKRGKSRGLVDVCNGWRPKSVGTVLAREAFAADGGHRRGLSVGVPGGLSEPKGGAGRRACPGLSGRRTRILRVGAGDGVVRI
jgi:hypothetical protein